MAPDVDTGPRPCDPAWIRELALRAGEQLDEAAERRGSLRVDHKGRVDLVTETDLAVQRRLVDRIRESFPDDRIVAEEEQLSEAAGADGAVWYIDPLDGTTNFVHGYPFYAVSVARWVGGAPETGAVFAPALDELYLGRSGAGATVERPRAGVAPRRLRVGSGPALDDALVATGFPYHRGSTVTLNLAICARALARVRGVRRGGSAALDLCHVAEGRLDGYWEMGLAPWDIAAALLVAREAGVRVSDFQGSAEVLHARRLVAAGEGLHETLRELILETHRAPDLSVLGALDEVPVPLDGPLPGELV